MKTPITAEERNRLKVKYSENGFKDAFQLLDYEELIQVIELITTKEMEQYAQQKVLEEREEIIKEALKPLYLMRELRQNHGYFGGHDNGQVIEREIKCLEDKLTKR